MLRPLRTAAPATSPVSVDDLKNHVRAGFSDDDTLLQGLIDAASAYLDGHAGILGRALITQTWVQDFAAFAACLRLPIGNLLSISSVQYYDASNMQQTAPSSLYASFTDALGPYLRLLADQSWPSTFSRDDAVRVTWTAGFGPSATDVPKAIRQAILMLAAHWYENREAASIASGNAGIELPFAVSALLAPFRMTGV